MASERRRQMKMASGLDANRAGLTRRDLLAMTALGLAAGAPTGAIAIPSESQLTWGVHVSLAPV